MAEPTIRIELEAGDWGDPKYERYHFVGGRVRGRVIVDTQQPIDAKDVRVAVGWATQGRGDPDSAVVAAAKLHEGPIGTTQSFPFSLALPTAGPITYRGHYIQIVWTVTAVLNVRSGRGLTTEEGIVVVPAPDL